MTVDTNDDVVNGNFAPGDRSLRELIELANASDGFDTILFAPGLAPVITLDPALGPLVIHDTLSIVGPGANQLAIEKDPAQPFRLVEITASADDVTISGLAFHGGNAMSEDGGAIRFQSPGNLVVVRSSLSNNKAASGGAIAASAGTVSIAASTLSHNTASLNGGGLAGTGAATSLSLVDTTVSTNEANGAGGGIFGENATMIVASSTLTLNVAASGGGIGLVADAGGESLEIVNSIVADNSATSAPDFLAPMNSSDLDVEFSLIGDSAGTTLAPSTLMAGQPQADAMGNLIGGGSNPVIDPLLGPLAMGGGPTITHSLLDTSPAIDAGNNTLLPADEFDIDGDGNRTERLPIDQRGAARVVNDLDMGAVELAPVAVVTWDEPANIVFGTPLDSTQLNATSTAVGTFAYSPAATTILSAGDDQVLTATFTPNDPLAFRPVTVTVTIDALKADPVVSWADPEDMVFGTLLSDSQLNATTDTPGSFVYDPASGVRLDAGDRTLSVTFTPQDTANYNEVVETASLTVLKADPQIDWSDPADIDFGVMLDSTQLNATADVPGVFVYSTCGRYRARCGRQSTTLGDIHPDRRRQLQHRDGDCRDQCESVIGLR